MMKVYNLIELKFFFNFTRISAKYLKLNEKKRKEKLNILKLENVLGHNFYVLFGSVFCHKNVKFKQ